MFVRTVATIACCAAALGALELSAATAGAAPNGNNAVAYKGKTGQGRGIVLRVANGELDLRRFSIRLRCGDGSALIDQESGFEPAALNGKGGFREYQLGSTDKVWFRGRVNNRAVKGRVKVKDRWGKVRCNSGWVKFHAKRRG
ncbi:MAG: hypothetical protein AB7V58_03410 [Solirubrobacterales bacterium]